MTNVRYYGIIATNKWGDIMDKRKENELINSTIFMGYIYRKQNDLLYSKGADVAKSVIKEYYSNKVKRLDPSIINRRFVNKYIKNESAMEEVHEPCEIKGLEVMYEDMVQMPFNEFEMFSLISLHRDLYSKCPHPEAGGVFRTGDVYLPGTGTDLVNYSYIFDKMIEYEDVFNPLKEMAHYMKTNNDYSYLLEYVERCVKLNCSLIKLHPFGDGNGRTVRCFLNKLFIEAGIPPVYVELKEKTEYARAMNVANNEGDYDDIVGFYLYKICDSIIELDIKERIKEEKDSNIYEKKKSKKRR